MSVLVTGASGFVGSAVVRALGQRAVAASRTGPSSPRLRGWDGRHLRLDPRDEAAVDSVLDAVRPRAVVHAAVGRDAHDAALRDQEVAMVDAVCGAAVAADVEVVVVFGSATEYGTGSPPLREEQPRRPLSIHGRAKAAGVDAAQTWRDKGPTIVLLRPFHVTGRGEPLHKLVPRVLEAAHGGRPVPLVPGPAVRDLVHVDDVARAVVAAVDDPPLDGGAVNLCSGRATTPAEVVDLVRRRSGRRVTTAGQHARTEHDEEQRIGDPARAEALWGWRAASLEELVDRCLADWPWRAP